ncbi:MAG TPA: hypothetical protein VFQ19_01565, partial [Nocardioidaceae bacterium]|nr:hypothetical protein [Nocardioidaceae bacterium]
ATNTATGGPANAHCPPGGSPPGDVDGLPNEEEGETDRNDHCVEAVNPVVNQSEECDEEGFLRIRSTRGVQYFLDGEEIEAGIHRGPITGTVTAKPSGPTFELSNPNFSFEVDIPAAKDCATASPSVSPSQTATVSPSQTATVSPSETATVIPSETATTVTPSETASTIVPSETATTPGEVAGTDAVPPIDETPEVVPTAVDAGLPGGPAATSSTELLAKMLVGGGLALMMAAGWLQMGRHNRGAHQA